MTGIDNLVRCCVKSLKPYSSARDEYVADDDEAQTVFLDANESPFNTGLNRYPDPYQSELKAKLAEFRGVATKQIIFGNGSDEIIDLLFRAFCEPGSDQVVIMPPTYGMYKVCAGINNVDVIEVPLLNGSGVHEEEIRKISGKAKLLFVCTPNNPTGMVTGLDQLEKILETFEGLVVVDEAYIDFSSKPSALTLIDKYNNLVVLQTFSKAWGLAGIRLGVGFASEDVVSVLNKIKPPYNVNQLTQQVAIQALDRVEQQESWVNAVLAQREVVVAALEANNTIKKVWPSEANFVLVEVANAIQFYEYFKAKGIILRNRSSLASCENCVRITIGTMEENVKLLEVLNDYQEEKLS